MVWWGTVGFVVIYILVLILSFVRFVTLDNSLGLQISHHGVEIISSQGCHMAFETDTHLLSL